jgi:hypothetical protein
MPAILNTASKFIFIINALGYFYVKMIVTLC